MCKLIVAALLAVGPALADDMVFKSDGLTVRLEGGPCMHKIVQDLLGEQAKDFRHGHVVHNGKQIGLCWSMIEDGKVIVVDAAGNAGHIPANLFKRTSGV